MVVLNPPNNPTGARYHRAQFTETVTETARKGLWGGLENGVRLTPEAMGLQGLSQSALPMMRAECLAESLAHWNECLY